MPYTTNRLGQGPAWANSLFEDNAEFGLGMHLGAEKLRDRLASRIRQAVDNADERTQNRRCRNGWIRKENGSQEPVER